MTENGGVHRLIAALWRSLRGPLQWRILYLVHARFMVGVTVACWNDRGEVLLVRHRFWPAEHPSGLPSGYARRGEELAVTARREVLLNGTVTGGGRHLDNTEIEDAGFFVPEDVPEAILPSHREKIERARLARHRR